MSSSAREPARPRLAGRGHALRLTRAGAIWLYVGGLSVLAAGTFIGFVHGTGPLTEPHLAWWLLAPAFLVAEACVVHLQFRRSAHSFSLADIPFVLALVFATGDAFVAAALLGAGVVWAFRRLQVVKVAFNLAQLALAVCAAVVILHAVAPEAHSLVPRTWVGVYLATLASGALTILCIAGAITIADGDMKLATLRQMFAMDGVVTATNTSIGLAAALVLAADARALPVLLVPALSALGIYRAYVSERQRHEKLEFLYEANKTLSRSPEVAEAIDGLLARSLEAFRSEIAEVVLLGTEGVPLRTTHGPGRERVTMQEADPDIAMALGSLVDSDAPVVSLVPPFQNDRLRTYFEQRGIRHAMVAMLPGEERTIGTIMLANRFGLERGYTPDDLRLLEALANNASVALQYDRLEQAVTKLRSLQDQLHHQAYHDPLTGLPNRALFMERVREELASGQGAVAATSRSSTTRWATPSATRCSSPWASGCAPASAHGTWSRDSEATSSRSCCRGSIPRRSTPRTWPRASCERSAGPCGRATNAYRSISASASPTPGRAVATPTISSAMPMSRCTRRSPRARRASSSSIPRWPRRSCAGTT